MNKLKIRLENGPYFLFLALVFLLPLFFIPSNLFNFAYGKVSLIFLAVLISVFFWVISSFKSGKLVLPWNWISLSALSVPIIFLLASLFSPNKSTSLIGFGYELGTFNIILLFFLLMFFVSTFVRNKDKAFYFYLGFGASFIILAIYEILRLFLGPNFLSLNYFTTIIDNPAGSWNDLAIISGLSVLLSLISLEFLVLNRTFKVLFYAVLAMGLFLLGVTNFSLFYGQSFTIFTLVGILALILFVYLLSRNQSLEKEEGKTALVQNSYRKISIPALIVLVLAVVFTVAATPLNTRLNSIFSINSLNVAPTWQSTALVAKDALKADFVFGIGPNRFSDQWNLSKPEEVNVTDFWNTDFDYGVGLIPTFIVTTGILGILSVLLFLGLFIYLGLRAIFTKIADKFSLFLIISSFFASLYLWIMNIVYVPGLVTWSLTFIFSGLFLGSLFREKIIKEKSISYVEDSRKGFAVILLLIFVIVGTISWGYFETNKILASIEANRSVIALNNLDVAGAENAVVKAASTDKNPAYYRILSQVELSKMNVLLSNNNLTADTIKTQFQDVLNNAVTAANVSTTLDPTDYQNWLSLGRVYATVIPLGVASAADQATSAFQNALERNPKNPSIYLLLANVEISNRNNDKAKEYISSALKLKNNYLDAIYLLAQLDLNEGKNDEAVAAAQAAVAVSPNNPNTYYQLGLLDYGLKDYNGAVSAFTAAIALVPNYADAKYYRGLSFYNLDRISEAEVDFQALIDTNPDNPSLKVILANLKAGRDPLSTSTGSSTKSSQ